MKELEGMVEDVGTEPFSAFSNKAGKMSTIYEKLLMDLKSPEMLQLGVLQKIDLDQMRRLLPDPNAWTMSGTQWKARADVFKRMMVQDMQSKAASLGGKFDDQLFQRVGFMPKAPEGAGLAPGERVEQRTNQSTGQTMLIVVDSNGNPLRPYPGAD
jgi:hypothetical protein